jgi:hypothetical protein
MTDPALALQKAIRARLVASAVTALVPANSIIDRNERPETFPCIVIGEDQTIDDPAPLARDRVTVFATLHLWHREAGLVGVKQIAGAIRTALAEDALTLDDWHVVDMMIQSTRYLRDPDGQTAHGVLTVEATLQELVA